jgi:probable F420-dependent oxidoreductase
MLKFWLLLAFEPHDQLLDLARAAEDLGYEGVLLPDHVVIRDGDRTPHPGGWPLQADDAIPDPIVSFSAMAAVTTRLRFLTSVLVVPLRDPFMLAKQVGTLAVLSNNRVVLGTGVGWLEEEFDTVGKDFANRGRRMDEMLDILVQFWTDGYAEYHGEHYDFERSGMFPVPTEPIPVWIGGNSMRAARRAARFDGYMPMFMLDDKARAEFALVDKIRAEEGRTSQYSRIVPWPAGNDPSFIQPLVAAGITDVVIGPWGYEPRHNIPFTEKILAAEAFASTAINAAEASHATR